MELHMMDITSDNLTMITLLSTVQEMIRTFRREHPGMLPAEADARLVITLNQLSTSKENLNKAGESLDKLLIDKLQSMHQSTLKKHRIMLMGISRIK